MAIIQVLDTQFKGEGLNAPKITKIDKIESPGSLLLVDVSREDKMPASGETFINLFEENCQQLSGEATSAKRISSFADPTLAKSEVTAKNGLHFIGKNQVLAQGVQYPENYENIRVTGGAREYLKQHYIDHDFYFSLWANFTNLSNKQMYPANMSRDANHNFEKVFYIGLAAAALNNQTGKQFMYTQVFKDGLNTAPGTLTPFNIFNGGQVGLNQADRSNARIYESIIFYRFYMEDLTVSGRTYDEVKSLDQQLFNEAFAAGGKFANDVYTDPLTAF